MALDVRLAHAVDCKTQFPMVPQALLMLARIKTQMASLTCTFSSCSYFDAKLATLHHDHKYRQSQTIKKGLNISSHYSCDYNYKMSCALQNILS